MACNTTHSQLSLLNAGSSAVYYNFGQPLGGYEANNTRLECLHGGRSAGHARCLDRRLACFAGPAWPGGGLDAALAGKVLKNSDVLVVYSTLRSNSPPAVVTSISSGANSFTVQNPYNSANGQIAVIADCAKSIVFQIKTVAGTTVLVRHQGTPGNTASSFPVSFQVGSQVTPIDTTVYYIGKGADGDGALFSYDLNAGQLRHSGKRVGPDIESMQMLYGVDTTGTQTVDRVHTGARGRRFQSVMSVKIAVLAASPPGAVPKPTVAQTYNLLGNTVTAPKSIRAHARCSRSPFQRATWKIEEIAAMRHQRKLKSPIAIARRRFVRRVDFAAHLEFARRDRGAHANHRGAHGAQRGQPSNRRAGGRGGLARGRNRPHNRCLCRGAVLRQCEWIV